MVALTAYLTSTTDTLLTTSKQITSTAPSAETSFAGLKNAKNTGWFFIDPITQATATSASEPAPNGHGWLWDVTTLEGQTIAAGTWTPKIKIATSSSWTGTVHVRAYKYNAGQYTAIADFTTVSAAISTTATVLSPAAQSLSGVPFATGDKLYVDVVVDITTAGGSTTGTTTVYFNGGANEAITTPGYAATLPDFIMFAPSAVTAYIGGGNVTTSVTLAATNAISENVTLSSSGVPAGATLSFTTNPIVALTTSNTADTITLSVGSAVVGAYTITITGTGNGTGTPTHSTTFVFTVSNPDFTISASSASTTAYLNEANGVDTITTGTLGSTQTVALTVTGTPTGATATLNPTSVTSGSNSTLTVQAGTASIGSYTLTVHGVGNGTGTPTHTTTITLNIATLYVQPTITAGTASASVQATSGTVATTGGTVTATLNNCTLGNTLVAIFCRTPSDAGLTAPFGWYQIVNSGGANSSVSLMLSYANAGTNSISVTYSNGTSGTWCLIEFSGIVVVQPQYPASNSLNTVDGSSINAGTTINPTLSLAADKNNNTLIVSVCYYADGAAITVPTGYTAPISAINNSGGSMAVGIKPVNTNISASIVYTGPADTLGWFVLGMRLKSAGYSAIVQNNTANQSGSTASTVTNNPNSPFSKNSLILARAIVNSTTATITISDNKSNSYTGYLNHTVTSGDSVYYFWTSISSVSSTIPSITATTSTSGLNLDLDIIEIYGVNNTSPIDVTATSSSTTAVTTVPALSIILSQSEMAIAYLDFNGSGYPTPPTGWVTTSIMSITTASAAYSAQPTSAGSTSFGSTTLSPGSPYILYITGLLAQIGPVASSLVLGTRILLGAGK